MQDEKKVNTKTVDPVVDQKIIKKDRPGWLLCVAARNRNFTDSQ